MIESMFGATTPIFGRILTSETAAARNVEVKAQRQSVVCDGQGERPLSALAHPIDDGCTKKGSVAAKRDPT